MGGMTALHYAAREGLVAAVQALVELGANVNKTSPVDKSTALVVAITTVTTTSPVPGDHGADPNIESIDGLGTLATLESRWAPVAWTPTAFTVVLRITQQQVDYLSLIKLLLDHGANSKCQINKTLWFDPPHHNDSGRRLPGRHHLACRAGHGYGRHEVACGSWGGPQSSSLRTTPRLRSRRSGLERKLPTNAPNSFLAAVKYLVEDIKINVNTADESGYTALMGAAYRGDNEVVQYLTRRARASVSRTKRGWSVTIWPTAPTSVAVSRWRIRKPSRCY